MTRHEANAVTQAEYQAMLAAFGPLPVDMGELAFTTKLVQYATGRGWLCYHAKTSRLNDGRYVTAMQGRVGFPDLVAVRDDRAVVAELKRQGAYPSAEQREWLETWRRIETRSGGAIRAFVWRPADYVEIEAVMA